MCIIYIAYRFPITDGSDEKLQWLFLYMVTLALSMFSFCRFKSYITRKTIGKCSLLLCFIKNCHPFLTNQVMFVCVWGGGGYCGSGSVRETGLHHLPFPFQLRGRWMDWKNQIYIKFVSTSNPTCLYIKETCMCGISQDLFFTLVFAYCDLSPFCFQ